MKLRNLTLLMTDSCCTICFLRKGRNVLKMWCGLEYIPNLMIHATEIYLYHLSNNDLGKLKSPLDSLFEEEVKEMRRKIEYNGDTRSSYVLSKQNKKRISRKNKK